MAVVTVCCLLWAMKGRDQKQNILRRGGTDLPKKSVTIYYRVYIVQNCIGYIVEYIEARVEEPFQK